MTSVGRRFRIGSWWLCVVLSLATTRAGCAEAEPAGKTYFQVEVRLFSVEAGDKGGVASSYRTHGSGTAGPGGSVGLGISLPKRRLEVTILHKQKAGCHVEVKVESDETDLPSQRQTHDLDLSDLEPVSLRLTPEGTGRRTVILNLIPSIRRLQAPAPLDSDALGITRWAFHASPVIVNGWHYAGEINMAGGELGYVDLPGLAKVEFSLKPFRGAEPTGVLQNGTISLTKEAPGARRHTIEIRDVRTGSPVRIELGSRAYQVWVRWSEPSQSLEDAIAEILALDLEKPPARLEYEAAARERILQWSRRIKEQLRRVDPADLSYDGPLAAAREALSLRAGMGPIVKPDLAEAPPADR